MKNHCARSIYKSNSVATPLLIKTNILHQQIFKHFYPCPLKFEIKKGQISMKSEKILQSKYIPFLIAVLFFVYLQGLSINIYLPVLKFFNREASVGILPLFVCLFLIAFISVHLVTCILFCRSREIETLFNQIHASEINCKQVNALN